MMCDYGDSTGPFTCINCGTTKQRYVVRKCSNSKPAIERTDGQLLQIIVNHCSDCGQFKDAATFEKLKCRRIPSCACLWKRAKSALFACPANPPRFGRDENLIKRYNNADVNPPDNTDIPPN